MYCLKQINKPFYSMTLFYSRFSKGICSQRNLGLEKCDPKNESNNSCSHNLSAEYENKLLFNSVISFKRISYGYKNNIKKMADRVRYNEHISTALKTIRPLPLTFKYFNKNNTEVNQGISTISNTHESHVNENISKTDHNPKNKVAASVMSKESLDKKMENWMTSYDNYEYDLVENENKQIIKDLDEWKINYGTPNPNSNLSNYPCGGCGAHLHCRDTATPGYIPSEIYKNCFKPGGANLGTILCQRCHFLNEYNIALKVRVSSDEYPKVLQAISFESAFVVLLVDLTDFPCSIWPGLADILGPRTPIIVVGNKVDLIPKDDDKYLKRVKEVLHDNIRLSGFATANIKNVALISAKTGYGVEDLISSMQRVVPYNADVYLIGCVNVGKSSLFNTLLQSDFCKIQAADLIQRASTSTWPGTTLNLLKFPITTSSGHRSFLRRQRLKQLQAVEAQEIKLRKESLKKENSVQNATLVGRIDRSFDNHLHKEVSPDSFSLQGFSNLSGKTKMGIDERHPDYAFGKWCFDTPGVVHHGTILHLLTSEELDKTLPKQLIRPETFCVQPGTTVFIAGLARFDYVKGPNSIRLTVFRAKDLPITVCYTAEADFHYKELLGSELFSVPMDKGDRLTKWPGLEPAKYVTLVGKSYKESSHDVVLSNAGWIAVNCGYSEYDFQAWTPEKRGVYVRDCMLPKAVTLRGARIRFSVAYKKNRLI